MATAEDWGRAGDSAAYPVCLDLRGSGICVWFGAGAGQRGDCPAGRGRSGAILSAKRSDPASDCVPYQPLRTSQAGFLDAEQGAGIEVHNTKFCLWIKCRVQEVVFFPHFDLYRRFL